MPRGRIIAVLGRDGSGGSTVVARVACQEPELRNAHLGLCTHTKRQQQRQIQQQRQRQRHLLFARRSVRATVFSVTRSFGFVANQLRTLVAAA